MKYINPYSRKGLVNRLAEKISIKLSDNGKYSTAVEVTDCVNFFVVKGVTVNNQIINLVDFKHEFMKEESDFIKKMGIRNINLIDVIEYKQNISLDVAPYWFEFYNSKRPIYHKQIIEVVENEPKYVEDTLESLGYTDKLEFEVGFPSNFWESNRFGYSSQMSVSSNFPYGYTLDFGKSYLYYSEYICNQLFSVLNTSKIFFRFTKDISDNGDLNIIINSNSQYSDEDVKSMVLDIFDFNIVKFETDFLRNYDFISELTNPFDIKPWINRDKVRELMFV